MADGDSSPTDDSSTVSESPGFGRRTLLRGVGAGAPVMGGGSILNACASTV
jgi:hypothetical protein